MRRSATAFLADLLRLRAAAAVAAQNDGTDDGGAEPPSRFLTRRQEKARAFAVELQKLGLCPRVTTRGAAVRVLLAGS